MQRFYNLMSILSRKTRIDTLKWILRIITMTDVMRLAFFSQSSHHTRVDPC